MAKRYGNETLACHWSACVCECSEARVAVHEEYVICCEN